ncbi:MAG: hypothetical protein ACI9WU_001031, partial [Myxococcota bacterium]
TALDADGESVVVGVLPLLQCPEAGLTHLPVHRQLGELVGEHRIIVQALEDEVEVARVEARAWFDGDANRQITLQLQRVCLGVPCPLGQTCIDGKCEVIPFAEESPMPCPVEQASGPEFGDPAVHCGVLQ